MYDREAMVKKFSFYILGTLHHVRQTVDFVEKTMELDGDYCELGSYIGGNCAIMGQLCEEYGKNKKIYLYDSFAGIPYPTEEDMEIPGNPEGIERTGELKSTGISIAPMEWVIKTLELSGYNRENYIINQGWIQESLPATINSITPLAFLRIDLDLYASTKLGLEYMYDKVIQGGYIMVHDYQDLTGCRQAVNEFVEKHPEINPIQLPYNGGIYWVKGG